MGKQSFIYLGIYIIASICGFFLVMNTAAFINQAGTKMKFFLILCGNNTLSILTWHFTCFKIISYLIVLVNNEPFNRIAEFPQIRTYSREGWWIVYTIVGVILPLIISQYQKYAKNINS